jgi:hypothetical protein
MIVPRRQSWIIPLASRFELGGSRRPGSGLAMYRRLVVYCARFLDCTPKMPCYVAALALRQSAIADTSDSPPTPLRCRGSFKYISLLWPRRSTLASLLAPRGERRLEQETSFTGAGRSSPPRGTIFVILCSMADASDEFRARRTPCACIRYHRRCTRLGSRFHSLSLSSVRTRRVAYPLPELILVPAHPHSPAAFSRFRSDLFLLPTRKCELRLLAH